MIELRILIEKHSWIIRVLPMLACLINTTGSRRVPATLLGLKAKEGVMSQEMWARKKIRFSVELPEGKQPF